jgi:hypothetical protein
MAHPPLEHDPEKACLALDAGWTPVFRKRSCSDKKIERMTIRRKVIPLYQFFGEEFE